MIGKNGQNNLAIAVNVLYAANEKIYPAYFSKPNSNLEKETSQSFNNSKRRIMILYCIKKITCIIKMKKVKNDCVLHRLNCLFFHSRIQT